MRPTSRMAIIIRLVATGRSMKRRDGFTEGSLFGRRSFRRALSGDGAAPSAPAAALDRARAGGGKHRQARAGGHRACVRVILLNRSRFDEILHLGPDECARIGRGREFGSGGDVDGLRLRRGAAAQASGEPADLPLGRDLSCPPAAAPAWSTTVTFAPSRSRSTPSITTLSPAASPDVIMVYLPFGRAGDDVALGDRKSSLSR